MSINERDRSVPLRVMRRLMMLPEPGERTPRQQLIIDELTQTCRPSLGPKLARDLAATIIPTPGPTGGKTT